MTTHEAALNEAPDKGKAWQTHVWIWVCIALAVLGGALLLIVGYTLLSFAHFLFKEHNDLLFVFSGMSLLILTLLRILALMIGAGMVFGGLAISFFAHANMTRITGEAPTGLKGSLTTSSPGIAAICVGAIVILGALLSKGSYEYKPSEFELVSPATLEEMKRQGQVSLDGRAAPNAQQPPTPRPPMKAFNELFKEAEGK